MKSEFKLTHGIYKGKPVHNVPTEYLEFLINQMEHDKPEIMKELESRTLAAGGDLCWMEQIVQVGKATLLANPAISIDASTQSKVTAAAESLAQYAKAKAPVKHE